MPPKSKPRQIVQSLPILPPGSEKCSNEQFGEFQIKMGKVQWVQDANPHQGNLLYRVKFLGQEGDGLLIQPANSNSNQQTELNYEIRVPIIGFHRYLVDAEKLSILLVDSDDKFNILGIITLNFARHLNKDLSRNQIFHNISGQYPIYKYFADQPNNQEYRIGYQQIEINCKFILIQQQIELCQLLEQTTNIQSLQMILDKQPQVQQTKQTQHPSVNVMFPTENEAWLQQNPNQKLANVLFANNPFEKPKVEEPSYDQNKYINAPQQQNEKQTENQGSPNHNQQQVNQQQQQPSTSNNPSDRKQPPTQVDDVQRRMEQLFNQLHCIHCCPKRSESANNNNNVDSNKKEKSGQKEPEPFRNTKPGSGHYNNSPTGYRYANKGEAPKPVPPKFQSTRNKTPVTIPEGTQTEIEEKRQTVKYQIDTKEVQTIQEAASTPVNKQQQLINYNPALDSYRKLKIQLQDFHSYSSQVSEKLNAINLNNIFIDISFKNQQKRLFFKSQGQELYLINETIELEVYINESSFSQFQADQVKFLIQCYRKPENSTDDKYFKITLGEGYFQVIQALSNEQFYIPITTNLPFDRQTSNSNLQYSVVNKNILNEYQLGNRLGEIRLKATFQREKEQEQFQEQPLFHIYHSFNPTLLIRLGKLINLNQVYCRFKIPGSNDFFQSQNTDSLYLNYQIITPLNFESFQKLQVSPLIIEVWRDEGLQGMIRISLSQISQTLSTEDQQFNSNVFKNTYPLIMSDEQQPIKKLKDQKEVGSLHVYIAFGSPNQIQKIKIENIQTKSIQEASNQYEEQREEPLQVVEVQEEEPPRELTFQESYEQFQLDKNQNNHVSIIQVLQFMSKNEILLQKHLKKFFAISELEFLNFDNHSIFVFCRIFDYQNQNTIKQEDLLQSLTAYNLFHPRISIEINKQVKRLISFWMDQKVDSLEQVGKMLIKSNCGHMDKKKVSPFIGSFNFEFFEYFLASPNDRNQLSIKLLNELVCQYITYNYVKLDNFPESWFCWLVQNFILQKVQTISLEEIEQMVLNIREVQDILSACLINISLWEVYCLFRYIKLRFNNFLLQEWQLQKSLLQEWLNLIEVEEPEIPKHVPKKPKLPEFDDKENQNQNQVQPQEFYVHKFSIILKEITNLKLSIAHGTQMEIEFRYPLCEQAIKSYPLIYSKLTQYQVPSESMYTYIQANDGKNKLIDVVDSLEGGILFRLKANDQTLAQTLLSSQEIVNWMEKENINKDKILVLMPVNGKLSFTLSYSRELITQQQLSSNPELLASHNQTQQEIHLPKRVGLSVYAEITVNDKALKFEDKILKVDIFSAVNFTAQISKQQGQKTIIINEEKPLAVDNDLIQQLTTQQMIIQVSSNSQTCIGKCELMQAQLLRTSIEGEFALTNSYGLFVGFAKLKVQLNKYKLPLAQQQTLLKEKEAAAVEKQITCILSFKEIIISLATLLKPVGSDEVFIYFSTKHNGKVYTTNPEQIDKKKLSCQLATSSIALELSKYQELNIIVYSSKKNQANQLKDVKLGELCLKFNSLTQSQIDSKFLCINDYFTLNYDSFVSRVGIKLILINEYDEQIPNLIKFYQNNQIYGCSKLSELKLDRYLYDYLVKLIGTQEYTFLCDQIGYHMNKQNFFLSESNITWDLIEEVYKLSTNGFMTEEKAKALLDSFFIVNFTEKSYTLFTKPNVFDKFVDKHLNQFDCQVFLSKLNLNFEVQKMNEIIIQIVRGSNLHVLNQNKAPNAVIQVMFNGESYRTPVQVRESNPVFNYCFNARLEPNQNIEFRVLNSGAERESLGSCFINSSELINRQQSSEEIKMYVHGSKAQAYVIVKVGNEQPYLKTLEEVQKYQIDDVDFERIRAIIGKQ